MRDFTRFDSYLNRLTQDVYAQPADEGHQAWGLQALRRMLAIPQGCKNVLDIGCGQGQFAGDLEDRGLKWTGLTLGEDYHAAKALGLNVHEGDMTFLPFEDRSFDLLFVRHALEHSPCPVVTLMEFRRVCRGWMALILPAPAFWTVRGRNHYSVLPKDNWLWLLSRAGWNPMYDEDFTTDDPVFLQFWRSNLPPEAGIAVEYRFLCEQAPEVTA